MAGLGLALAVHVLGLPAWVVPAGLGLLVLRDLVLYPAMRAVFRPATPAQPIGVTGVAVDRLAPEGYVRIGAELWRAEAEREPIPEGSTVVVTGARGLTLRVRRPAA